MTGLALFLAIVNGGFEEVVGGKPARWRGECKALDFKEEWRRFTVRFRTRRYRKVRLYLRLQFGTGTVWFDDVSIRGARIVNPSFERATGNRLEGWGQDDVGRTIFVDEKVSRTGRRSLRIERNVKGMSRVWQDIEVKPNAEYVLVFWARWRNVKDGPVYAEFYGVNPDGTLGAIIGSSPRLWGTSGETRRRVCEVFRGEQGTSWAWQEALLPANSNLIVKCWANTEGLEEGEAALRVVGEGGKLLGEARLTAGKEGWEALTVRIRTGETGRARIMLGILEGKGRALFDHVSVGPPEVVPTPQRVRWLPAGENFGLTEGIAIVVPDGSSGRALTGPRMLVREIRQVAGFAPPIVEESRFRGGRVVHIGTRQALRVLERAELQVPENPEGYALSVSPEIVAVSGRTERGTFYGVMTLLQLLARYPSGPEVVAAKIEDWPDLPFRCTYGLYGGSTKDAAEVFSRLKLNAVLIESGEFFDLHRPELRRKWAEAFEVLRLHFLDPIPELQSFGHGGNILSRNPNCAEGVWVRDERHVLKGTKPVALKHPNVLLTPSIRIEVRSADGRTVYVEGRDFEVVPGETKYPFRKDAKPFKIARIPTGRIGDGEEVLVSYDYAPPGTQAYCPNEPLVYEIMRKAIQETLRHLRPRYLHIGHDEIWRMGTDSRCIKARRSNAENLATDLLRLLKFAREVDPNVKIMLWADMLNPFHNGTRLFKGDPTAPAADLIPKDAFIMNVWFYGAGQPPDVGWRSLKWLSEKGFTTTGSPWYNPRNAYEWANVCYIARSRGMPCMGVIYTSWGGRWDALSTLAEYAWRHDPRFALPEEGEGR